MTSASISTGRPTREDRWNHKAEDGVFLLCMSIATQMKHKYELVGFCIVFLYSYSVVQERKLIPRLKHWGGRNCRTPRHINYFPRSGRQTNSLNCCPPTTQLFVTGDLFFTKKSYSNEPILID